MKLLFSIPCVSKYIHTYVVYLTTRVSITDKYDWRKLLRVLQYIILTIYMTFILRLDKLNIVKWWVDASYGVHTYCRSHTGATISLGWLSVSSMSNIEKLNSRRSKEVDLIGSDGVTPLFLWLVYFIE